MGGEYYFLTNTGWSSYDDNGKKKENAGPVKPVYKLRLVVAAGYSLLIAVAGASESATTQAAPTTARFMAPSVQFQWLE